MAESGDKASTASEITTTGHKPLGVAHLQFLALGKVRGKSSYAVAKQVGLAAKTVERVWSGELRPSEMAVYEQFVAAFSAEEATSATKHRTKMREFTDYAYTRIEDILKSSDDDKLAADTAWRVIEEGGVEVKTSHENLLGATIEGGGTVNLSQTQVVVNEAEGAALGGAVKNVLAEVENMGSIKHILEGNRHTSVNEKIIEVPVNPEPEPGEGDLE